MPDYLTFADVAAATHNEDLVPVVNEVTHRVTMWNDAPWKPSTDMLREIGGREGAPPRGTWVGVDEGAKPNKGSQDKYAEELGMIEAWSRSLKKVMALSPNDKELRWREDSRHLKGLGLDLEEALLYGNRNQDPRKFLGFMPRFGELTDIDGVSLTREEELPFITIGAGGNNANGMSSLLLVYWDTAEGAHLIFPSHKPDNGMEFTAYPYMPETQPDGTIIEVAKTKYACTAGLGIANRKSVIRIANIDNDPTNLVENMGKLESAIYDAFAAMPVDFQSRVKLYANNRTLASMRKAFAKRIVPAKYVDSVPKNAIGDVMFDSFIIRRCDSMLAAESKVS
ncbi:MAG: major capsid protein [Sphaerochaetaceae bacterium]